MDHGSVPLVSFLLLCLQRQQRTHLLPWAYRLDSNCAVLYAFCRVCAMCDVYVSLKGHHRGTLSWIGKQPFRNVKGTISGVLASHERHKNDRWVWTSCASSLRHHDIWTASVWGYLTVLSRKRNPNTIRVHWSLWIALHSKRAKNSVYWVLRTFSQYNSSNMLKYFKIFAVLLAPWFFQIEGESRKGKLFPSFSLPNKQSFSSKWR